MTEAHRIASAAETASLYEALQQPRQFQLCSLVLINQSFGTAEVQDPFRRVALAYLPFVSPDPNIMSGDRKMHGSQGYRQAMVQGHGLTSNKHINAVAANAYLCFPSHVSSSNFK